MLSDAVGLGVTRITVEVETRIQGVNVADIAVVGYRRVQIERAEGCCWAGSDVYQRVCLTKNEDFFQFARGAHVNRQVVDIT